MSRLCKILILLLIIIFTSVSIFIIYDKNKTNTYKLLSIGDGFAKGLSSEQEKIKNYNDYVKEYLIHRNKNILYYNYSIKDISISELTNDIIFLKDKKLKNYLQTANMIVLSIGEEEINKNKTINDIEEDLYNLISEIKKYNYNICLLGHYYLNNDKDKLIKEMNKVYKKVASDNDIVFLNIENIQHYNKSDIYPTKREYKEISNLIIDALNIKNK